jgi:hypothetical protein
LERKKGQQMVLAVDAADRARQELQVERQALLDGLEAAKVHWLQYVEDVEAVFDHVYINCGLIPGYEEQEESRALSVPVRVKEAAQVDGHEIGQVRSAQPGDIEHRLREEECRQDPAQLMKSSTLEMEPGAQRELISSQVIAARLLLENAQEEHDEYRQSYDSGLKRYTNDRADLPGVDVDAEFNRKWLGEWRSVIQEVGQREEALEEALRAARAANVTIEDPMDNGDPNFPYDVDWMDRMLSSHVDRGWIGMWVDQIIVGGEELPPVGLEEEFLETEALAQGRGPELVDTIPQPSVPIGQGIVASQDHATAVMVGTSREVTSPGAIVGEGPVTEKGSSGPPKLAERNALVSQSERAYGRRRNAINRWGKNARDGYC